MDNSYSADGNNIVLAGKKGTYILNGDWLMIDFEEGEQEKLIRHTAYILTESTIAE